MPYTTQQSTDGTDETIDIISPTGEHVASVPYWEDREKAEAIAGRVVGVLNAIYPVGLSIY